MRPRRPRRRACLGVAAVVIGLTLRYAGLWRSGWIATLAAAGLTLLLAWGMAGATLSPSAGTVWLALGAAAVAALLTTPFKKVT